MREDIVVVGDFPRTTHLLERNVQEPRGLWQEAHHAEAPSFQFDGGPGIGAAVVVLNGATQICGGRFNSFLFHQVCFGAESRHRDAPCGTPVFASPRVSPPSVFRQGDYTLRMLPLWYS